MSDQATPDATPAPTPKKPAAPDPVPTYLVHFQQNRSFELTVRGQIVATFQPYESKPLPADVINHPDFDNYRKLGFFQVQEV